MFHTLTARTNQGYKEPFLTHNTPSTSPSFHKTQKAQQQKKITKMKIQCDMCEKQEASVYCIADEASLCHGCDRRVHHANKLANKHPRFVLNDSSDQPPRCDICQVTYKDSFLK